MKLRKITRKFWGQAYKFNPYLLERTWGDGQQYIALCPMFMRPYFYVVRIDSKMDLGSDEFRDLLDLDDGIYQAIDEEFGSCCEEYSYSGECECDHQANWPAVFEWGGSTWDKLDKYELAEIGLKQQAA